MAKIILDLKSSPMKAWFDGSPGIVGQGYFPREAVGNLVMDHGGRFDIIVETTDGERTPFSPTYHEPGVGG